MDFENKSSFIIDSKYKLLEIGAKTRAEFFKDLEIDDVIELSFVIDYKSSNNNYAQRLCLKNSRTGQVFDHVSFRDLINRTKYMKFERIN